MRKNLLGKTGLEVSVLGLGGHEYRWLYGGNIVDSRQIRFNPERAKTVALALEKGVNFFDTTFQEEVQSLGHVLTEIGGRDKIYINGMVINALDQIRPMHDNERKEFIRRELETRLELLGSDYFDIFMLCNIGKGYDRENALQVLHLLQRHRDAGKFRFIGVSCHSYDILSDFLKMDPQIDVVMFQYNYALAHESGSGLDSLLAEINKRNIGMVAMKPLCWTMYGIPFTAINGNWYDLQELVKQSFAWQVTKGQAHTNVVGVESVEDFESVVAGVAMVECNEQLLAPYLEHKDRMDLLVRNGLKHSREIQSRIVSRCREQMGRNLGDSLEAYIKEFAGRSL